MINGVQTEMISARDRGLQYGDGCFETLRLTGGKVLLLHEHLSRLESSCELLRINLDKPALLGDLHAFLESSPQNCVLKILITRGVGGRGYASDNTPNSNRILMHSDLPADYVSCAATGIQLAVSKHRLSENVSLAGLKHLNRLDQVLASFDLHEPGNEALCLDQSGNVIEGTKSNLVLVINGHLVTPDLNRAGVKGIMLDYLMQQFAAAGHGVKMQTVRMPDVLAAEELFLCNSVFGVWPVRKLVENATVKTWPIGARTQQAQCYFDELLNSLK